MPKSKQNKKLDVSISLKQRQAKINKKNKINKNNASDRFSVRSFGTKRGNVISNTTTIPIAFDTMQGNVTFSAFSSKVSHPREGIDGIRLVGCQPLIDVGTAGADDSVFLTGTLATATAHAIVMSPDTFNGPLAAQANLHARFVFRDILLEYVSSVATTQANTLVLAVDTDTGTANAPTTFSLTRQICPSVSAPFRHDKMYLHYHYDGPELYWTEYDSASSASVRLTSQANIYGWASAAAAGAITYGYINVYYIIDLYQSVGSRGFTFRCDSMEANLLKQYLKSIRDHALDKISSQVKEISINDKDKHVVGLYDPTIRYR